MKQYGLVFPIDRFERRDVGRGDVCKEILEARALIRCSGPWKQLWMSLEGGSEDQRDKFVREHEEFRSEPSSRVVVTTVRCLGIPCF